MLVIGVDVTERGLFSTNTLHKHRLVEKFLHLLSLFWFTSFLHNCHKEILNKIEFLNPIPSSKKVVKYFFYPVTVNGDGDGKIIHRAFLLNDLAKFETIFITILHLLASPV